MSSLAPPPPVFVVGTGRCGSTLLSQFLAMHPGILSLSELLDFMTDLGGRIAESFPEEEIDGPGLWPRTITTGSSAIAEKLNPSVIRQNPPPDVPTATFSPQ